MQELVTTNTFGYNVDTGSAPRGASIQRCINSNASFHTIMVNSHGDFPHPTSANTVWEYYEALKDTVDDLILLVRFFSNREGNWSDYPDRARWANALKDIQLPPNTYIDSRCNEPNLSGNDPTHNKNYVQWEIDNLRAVSNAGHRYAVGAFSTGTPHESLIYSVYDDLWRAVDDYGGAIDMHLYGVFPLEAGETHPYDLVLNPAQIRDVFNNPTRWQNYSGWLVGRLYQVEQAYEEVNGEKPLVLVAESVLDRVMPDPFNSQWKSKFGMPQYQNDNRGLLSWERAMKAVFPELSFVQAIEKFLIHIRQNVLYGDNIRMALFGDNPLWNNHDWSSHKYSGHDVGDSSLIELHNHGLARVNAYPVYIESDTPQEPNPMPDPIFEPAIISSKNQTSIRFAPSVSGKLYTLLTATNQEQLEAKISTEPVTNADGFSWYAIQYKDMPTLYVAKTNNLVISEVPVTEPTDPPVDSNLVQRLDALQARVDAQDVLIDRMFEPVLIDLAGGLVTITTYRMLLPTLESTFKGLSDAIGEASKDFQRAQNGLPASDADAQGFSNVTAPPDTVYTNGTGEPMMTELYDDAEGNDSVSPKTG